MSDVFHTIPHRRKNILTGEWVLVSPHRTQRPWQGEVQKQGEEHRPQYDPQCYLCPGNVRANGDRNPEYTGTYVFTNDFSALLPDVPRLQKHEKDFFYSKSERGICRVVNFSPRHDLTLAEMPKEAIEKVIDVWCEEYASLGSQPFIRYVQIFENKGAMMGNSNPHPHCQIWAQEHIPTEALKEQKQFRAYYNKQRRSLLELYGREEKKRNERIVYENSTFLILVPYWAVWPYETLLFPKKRRATILEFSNSERKDFADALHVLTIKYDNVFQSSFPYSAGIHQAPTDGKKHPEWHLHMHFYPPLLRSSSIRKFMVGYEMLAEPQRDITPEFSAEVLRRQSVVHYKVQKSSQYRVSVEKEKST